MPTPTAHVSLHNITLTSPLGPDPWHRPSKPQPATASLRISYRDAALAAAEGDDVTKTLDYGKLYKRIERGLGPGSGPGEKRGETAGGGKGDGKDIRDLGRRIAELGFEAVDELDVPKADGEGQTEAEVEDKVEVWLRFPNAVLLADRGLRYWCLVGRKEVGSTAGKETGVRVIEEEVRVEGIGCACVIGVNPHERLERQRVVVGVVFSGRDGNGREEWGRRVVGCYHDVTRVVVEKVNTTSYQTVEALASYVAEIVTLDFDIDEVTVTVEKPSALAFVERAGVEVTRTKSFLESRKRNTPQ